MRWLIPLSLVLLLCVVVDVDAQRRKDDKQRNKGRPTDGTPEITQTNGRRDGNRRGPTGQRRPEGRPRPGQAGDGEDVGEDDGGRRNENNPAREGTERPGRRHGKTAGNRGIDQTRDNQTDIENPPDDPSMREEEQRDGSRRGSDRGGGRPERPARPEKAKGRRKNPDDKRRERLDNVDHSYHGTPRKDKQPETDYESVTEQYTPDADTTENGTSVDGLSEDEPVPTADEQRQTDRSGRRERPDDGPSRRNRSRTDDTPRQRPGRPNHGRDTGRPNHPRRHDRNSTRDERPERPERPDRVERPDRNNRNKTRGERPEHRGRHDRNRTRDEQRQDRHHSRRPNRPNHPPHSRPDRPSRNETAGSSERPDCLRRLNCNSTENEEDKERAEPVPGSHHSRRPHRPDHPRRNKTAERVDRPGRPDRPNRNRTRGEEKREERRRERLNCNSTADEGTMSAGTNVTLGDPNDLGQNRTSDEVADKPRRCRERDENPRGERPGRPQRPPRPQRNRTRDEGAGPRGRPDRPDRPRGPRREEPEDDVRRQPGETRQKDGPRGGGKPGTRNGKSHQTDRYASCEFGDWNDWSDCRYGIRRRMRDVISGPRDCVNKSHEYESCSA